MAKDILADEKTMEEMKRMVRYFSAIATRMAMY